MKFSVIIQWQLISFGQRLNNSVAGFDTLATILENIARFDKHDLCYIVSTWLSLSEQEQSIFNVLESANAPIQHSLSPKLFDPERR